MTFPINKMSISARNKRNNICTPDESLKIYYSTGIFNHGNLN